MSTIVAFLIILSLPAVVILHALGLTLLWEWFVVATFGVAPLSIPAALGLGLTVRYVTYQPDAKTEVTDTDAQVRRAWTALLIPIVAVVVGYIVKQFM